jgi:carbohydrate kinase (thermoresistant glucokinase family)
MIYIVMGVAGCGKSTVGKLLAENLGWRFIEGDEFHPPENVKKMGSGIPLNDDDRYGWLVALRNEIDAAKNSNASIVMACSALKEKYRVMLRKDSNDVKFVFLKGTFDTIQQRLEKRPGHFMKAGMLQSQFDALEEPDDAIVCDVTLPPDVIVRLVLAAKML